MAWRCLQFEALTLFNAFHRTIVSALRGSRMVLVFGDVAIGASAGCVEGRPIGRPASCSAFDLKSWAPFSVATLAALSKICELWGGLDHLVASLPHLLECFNMKSQTIDTMAQWGALIAIAAAFALFHSQLAPEAQRRGSGAEGVASG